MGKYETKNARTEAQIKICFIHLYSEEHLSQIRVDDICTAAGINRSTFYRHYSCIADVLSSIEQEMMEGVIQATEQLGVPHSTEPFGLSMTRLMEFFQKNKIFIVPLLSNSKSAFYKQYKNRIWEGIMFTVRSLVMIPPADIDYLACYAAGGAIDLILYWLECEDKTPEEMSTFFIRQLVFAIQQKRPGP